MCKGHIIKVLVNELTRLFLCTAYEINLVKGGWLVSAIFFFCLMCIL